MGTQRAASTDAVERRAGRATVPAYRAGHIDPAACRVLDTLDPHGHEHRDRPASSRIRMINAARLELAMIAADLLAYTHLMLLTDDPELATPEQSLSALTGCCTFPPGSPTGNAGLPAIGRLLAVGLSPWPMPSPGRD